MDCREEKVKEIDLTQEYAQQSLEMVDTLFYLVPRSTQLYIGQGCLFVIIRTRIGA